ncbi:hypothetical protein GH733_009119 [Mirounga leonina]|nr:hypothetical protein GH733_009119 [Mirounga leonina]
MGQASDVCPLLCCIQGQGALSERLRSFSMQDLTTIRGDGAPAPSSPPPPGAGRASGKHGQPKMSRSASESAGSSVVEGDVNEGGVKAWEPHQVQNPLAFSDEEEEDLLDFMYKYKAPRKMEFSLEAPPRVLRSRFRKKSTSSSATETTKNQGAEAPITEIFVVQFGDSGKVASSSTSSDQLAQFTSSFVLIPFCNDIIYTKIHLQ